MWISRSMSGAVLRSFCGRSLGVVRHQYKSTIFDKCCACRSQHDGYYRPNKLNAVFSRPTQNCFKSTLSTSGTDGVQVYYGILTPQIKAVKLFSLTTSIAGVMAQPILFYNGTSLGGIPVLIAVGTFVAFFTFVTPFLLHLITKKYVTELHYNSSSAQYTATVYNFFLQRKKITFQPNDVMVPEIPGLFTSFVVKGVPLFVDARLFLEPLHYAKIMGYDKPIDFKMENVNDSMKQDKT